MASHAPVCGAASRVSPATSSASIRRIRPSKIRSLSTFNSSRKNAVRARAGLPGMPPNMDPEKMKALQEEAMKDPKVAERVRQLQEAAKDPRVQQQMQQTMAMMQTEEMQAKLRALQEDEELKPMFEDMKKGGFGAMMKYFNDPETLRKIGQKLGPIPGAGAPPGAPPAPPPAAGDDSGAATAQAPPPAAAAPTPPPPPPEVNGLLDAARFGDLEAVEDFLAIGKDPNITDKEKRTPMHFAVATQQMDIIDALCGAGANLEMKDAKENTPLHYAAGYGRPVAVKRLLDNGASPAVRNQSGKTPFDLANLNNENPILKEEALVKRLEEGAAAAPVFQDQ